MTHLTPDELIDAMEGILAPDRQAHLAACDECRRQLDDLAGILNETKQASVPEPSPLFWPHFSGGVRSAIDRGAASGGAWPSWVRWRMLLPIGAAAMVILALMMRVPTPGPMSPVNNVAMVEPDGDDSWLMLAELVGEIDVETAVAAGVVTPGLADQAVLTLTAEEQQELTRLLQAELTRAKS